MSASPSPPFVVRLVIGAAAGLLIVSCGPSYVAPPVTPQLAKLSRSSGSQLDRGYRIHQAKCAKCHAFEDPAKFDADELADDVLPEMAQKAKLDAADEKAVLEYLLAARQLAPSVPPGS